MINNEELLFVVDENNNPVEPAARNEIHKKGYWHRTSHIWIINNKKEILSQKRTMIKDINPGKWEAHFGGHIAAGEKYILNSIKELFEEIGLKREIADMHFFKVYQYQKDKEFQGIFYTIWNGYPKSLTLEKVEVDEVRWVDMNTLKKIFQEKNKSWVQHEYEGELLSVLEKV